MFPRYLFTRTQKKVYMMVNSNFFTFKLSNINVQSKVSADTELGTDDTLFENFK